MVTNTSIPNNETAIANDQRMQAGIQQYWSSLSTLSPVGKPTTPAKLTAIFQADIDLTQKLAQLEAQVAELRVQQRAARTLATQTRRDCRTYIIGNNGEEAVAMLSVFGLEPPKKRKVAVAVKAAAQVKAKATRVARGTKGPKAKLAVKGVVPATTTEAPANAPAPAVPAAPAAPAK